MAASLGISGADVAADFAKQSKALAKSIDEVNDKTDTPSPAMVAFIWATVRQGHRYLTRDTCGNWQSWSIRPTLRHESSWYGKKDEGRFVCASPRQNAPHTPLFFYRDLECGK
jgi:hypothetical protein